MSAPIPAAVQKTLFHRRESAAFHTPYSYEKNLLDAVRSGDVIRAKECMNELSLTGKPGILSLNPLRHAQNLFIAHITQITRAAMEAGVEEDMAYAMSDSYIQASEKCTSVTRLRRRSEQGPLLPPLSGGNGHEPYGIPEPETGGDLKVPTDCVSVFYFRDQHDTVFFQPEPLYFCL